MRLLHTRDFRFQEFYNDDSPFPNTPPYAILSHRWSEEEVSNHEFLQLLSSPELNPVRVTSIMVASPDRIKSGYVKILAACDKASREFFDWIWIDTCCIDKTSSAELTEAINSMHSWYRESSFCYVHLADVWDGLKDREQGLQQFRKSDWFTRGWTLQELLAPRKLVFVDREWRSFGLREQLEETISEITKIPVECLGSLSARREKCVASKMKWAAKRQTSRIEDKAYCLLGLFDINMPLLYGEGFKAFKRLQEEIVRQSDDETIFVHRHSSHLSPLAYSPADFDTNIWGEEVERGSHFEFRETDLGSTSYSVTNKGIQMRAAFVAEKDDQNKIYTRGVIALNCHSADHPYHPVLLPVELMRVKPVDSTDDPYRFERRQRSGRTGARPDTYIVDLSNLRGGLHRDIEATERYLDSWIATGGRILNDKPFVYATIYLASGYSGKSRGIRT